MSHGVIIYGEQNQFTRMPLGVLSSQTHMQYQWNHGTVWSFSVRSLSTLICSNVTWIWISWIHHHMALLHLQWYILLLLHGVYHQEGKIEPRGKRQNRCWQSSFRHIIIIRRNVITGAMKTIYKPNIRLLDSRPARRMAAVTSSRLWNWSTMALTCRTLYIDSRLL